MLHIIHKIITPIGPALVTCLLTAPLSAQSLGFDLEPRANFTAEWVYIDFDDSIKPYFYESERSFFFAFELPISAQRMLVSEVGLAKWHVVSGPYFDRFNTKLNQMAFTNPYLGMRWLWDRPNTFFETGVFLPLVSNKNAPMHIDRESNVTRWEFFAPSILVLSGQMQSRHKLLFRFFAQINAGAVLWIETQDNEQTNLIEPHLKYGGQLGFRYRTCTVTSGLSGRMLMTRMDLTQAQRSFHQFEFAFNSMPPGRFWLGFDVRTWLDEEYRRGFDAVWCGRARLRL